ncbi:MULTISPECIES: M1 family metallopeptidase [Acidiplasma]|jgi:tricorn protease interacting factor F2/3|uniref:Aminopeptidase n=1 Tax=Acidiplasma aeolicum TaxID=507754 RepID=A0A0Q0VUX9_9ARCH|nr:MULTISPECIES: M1 family metallopeptidase [Acidiplasma]KJE49210.1 peptidase [Acidiplasma sp. MBA-1]KPV47186.1 peptidase [Acidiplasma aeolicum]KQB35434.1 peptidase [Acidiplasma aeolicum]WMT54833.1 MAG: M1 family metallopeptidase [Acidiplasma sp.]
MKILNYDIHLDIDFAGKKYSGTENIKIEKPDKKLELDINEIDIKGVKINGMDAVFSVSNTQLVVDNDSSDVIDLSIEFYTYNDPGLKGFYVAGDANKYILSTQFEESDARRAFPCFDNPLYKATFDLEVKIDKDLQAISNMPIKHEKIEANKKIVTFERTPVMSTYLLYIGIGHFDEMSTMYRNKRFYYAAMDGRLSKSSYPLDIAKKSVEYLENYTNIEYMLPKLHLIAVPEFAAGAMENWGAITFREILLNMDASSSSKSYRRSAEVITHELVHQWFGDLVTMKWWNDLWLNESFATFFAFKTVDAVEPSWNFFGDFLLDQTDGAYTMDSIINSHPINAEVSDPMGVSKLSYEIRYGKGSNVLRMIEAYTGNDVFMTGLRNYLKKFSYSNAEGSDLWNSIEEVSKKGISEIMNEWISKKGYPLLMAKKTDNGLLLTQEKFNLHGNEHEEWKIPLFINRFSGEQKILMEGKDLKLDGDIISLNKMHFGFYRVYYDNELFNNIIKNLDKISVFEKWGIINDMYALFLAGRMELTEFMRRMETFYKINEPVIIEEISKELYNLFIISQNIYFKDIVNFYIKDKIEYIEKNKSDDFNYKTVLSNLYSRLAYINSDFASKLVKKYSSFELVNPDERQAYLISRAVTGSDFSYFRDIIENSKSDEDKTKAIMACGILSENEDHDQIIDFIKSGRVKKQDADSFFTSMATYPESREFIVNNLETIVDLLFNIRVSNLRINRCVQTMISYGGLADPEKIKKDAEKIRRDEIEGGINKGLEFLEIFENAIKASN